MCALSSKHPLSNLQALELGVGLIQTQMKQMPIANAQVLRAEVGMSVRCANKESVERFMRVGRLAKSSRNLKTSEAYLDAP